MRRYETLVIFDPDISEEDRTNLLEKICDLIPKFNGIFLIQDDWGIKKLAYEIKKKIRGYYVRLDFCGDGSLVDELERFFRIDDRVMKYMSVLLDKDADPEKIKEEIAAETAAKASETADKPDTSVESTEDVSPKKDADASTEKDADTSPEKDADGDSDASKPETKEEE
ncbi:MAG: 30S ribosomal protein S6 [Desulfobacteraceae bacterium]|nr:30S ribosomal protein S6 [Desulfobacteraceae bacterium]